METKIAFVVSLKIVIASCIRSLLSCTLWIVTVAHALDRYCIAPFGSLLLQPIPPLGISTVWIVTVWIVTVSDPLDRYPFYYPLDSLLFGSLLYCTLWIANWNTHRPPIPQTMCSSFLISFLISRPWNRPGNEPGVVATDNEH